MWRVAQRGLQRQQEPVGPELPVVLVLVLIWLVPQRLCPCSVCSCYFSLFSVSFGLRPEQLALPVIAYRLVSIRSNRVWYPLAACKLYLEFYFLIEIFMNFGLNGIFLDRVPRAVGKHMQV